LAPGPVAIVGLFIDWRPPLDAFSKTATVIPATQEIPLPALTLSRLTAGDCCDRGHDRIFIGVPPAMMAALGAAALLITRTLEPKNLYREWTGATRFFVGLFIMSAAPRMPES
jgi:hypothetical protein